MNPHFRTPIITPRLLIRAPQKHDAAALHAAITESFDILHRSVAWAKTKLSLRECKEYIDMSIENWIDMKNEEPYLPLFIFEKNTGEFIGAGGFHHYDWEIPSIETGYWVRKSCGGQGFITEAVNAHTQYAFKQLKVHRIVITCDADNIKSKNIPEKLNYTLEARLKNHRRKPVTNELADTLVYAKYDLISLPSLAVTW